MKPGGTLDLQVDPAEADRRKRVRVVRLNTRTIPQLRVIGFVFVAAAALLHNIVIQPGPGPFSWMAWLRLVEILGAYSLGTWYLLYLFYEDARPALDLGTLLLACDMSMFSTVIYFTGADRSWLFFLPLFRVVDQTGTSFRRAMVFAHLAPLSYAAVILYVLVVQHRPIALPAEAAKVALVYLGSLYVAMVARTGAERQRRSTHLIRLARRLVSELKEKSKELERSSRQLHDALDQQAELHKENARLFSTTEAREVRLSQILHSTSDGIIFVGHDGRIEAANARGGDLLGFDPQTVIGVDVSRILARLYSLGDGDAFGATLTTLLAAPGAGGHGDLQHPSTGRILHWVAQPTRDTGGDAVGLTFTFQDVTPTRDLMRQLEDKSRLLDDTRRRAEEATRAKGEFLANVMHEVRGPLGGIVGMTDAILAAPAPADQSHDVIRGIQASARSLLTVLADILDFSQIDSRSLTLDREPLSLRGAMQEAVDTLRATAGEKGLALVLDVNPEVPDALTGDAPRLRQVLENLIGNAIKFTAAGTIRTRVDVASSVPGEVCLHFAVIDTGIGIPREKQELVFEAFAQADGASARRLGGAGLGLAISARLVELMGGDIWVESEVGRGTAFRFTANFGVQGSSVPARLSSAGRAARPVDVLVVDGEQVHRELIAHLLRARGHRVVTARDGREALVELARRPMQIALVDLQMPEVDGLQLASLIRTWERDHGGRLPLVAMTVSAASRDMEASRAAGIDETLIKPIARDRLYRLVEGLASDEEAVPPPPELAGRAAFLDGLGNDVILARRLIDLFLQDSGTLVDEIGRAIADEDADRLRRAAHALKGSVNNFPAGGARDAATRMELIGLDADFDAARDVFPVLEQEIDRLRGLLPALI